MSVAARINQGLAARFVNYQSLTPIPIEENNEPLANVADHGLRIGLNYSKLAPSTGEKLILRTTVCERLAQAQKNLGQHMPGYQLVLTYAYRSMDIQRSSFEKMKKELGFGDRTDPEALERTHHFIAVPEVSGHPTGGAVDLLIADAKGISLDFGTQMHALEQNSYAYSPFISDTATVNRKLLRCIMQEAGFAPYDGEWWHFSYGDREWAAYYGEQSALYGQLEAEKVASLG